MSYKYCVVWFNKAKMWVGKVRPLNSSVKVFRSLKRANEFQKLFVQPYPKIYKIMSDEGKTGGGEG